MGHTGCNAFDARTCHRKTARLIGTKIGGLMPNGISLHRISTLGIASHWHALEHMQKTKGVKIAEGI